jgi:cation diffusion facilitator CzcD-associated flavoprotein CzcO
MSTTTEHFDVLIVGAGLSGIGAGYHLQARLPGRTYAILEAREAIGGTWDLFRYPGVRSDSDMFTLGYAFRPWKEAKAIADGPSILRYVRETAAEFGIDRHIRFRHRVVSAAWSSAEARWTVEVAVGPEAAQGERRRYTCGFLYFCSGYYSYEAGYTPDFPGLSSFGGQVVHPQKWPEGLDYTGKRVVVIGSGATAVTLVPSMAEKAAHVTMLQRSPTYIASLPAEDKVANAMRSLLPGVVSHRAVRWKNVLVSTAFYQLCRRAPKLARRVLRAGVAKELPKGYALDPHFDPRYLPWDQRLCLVPDADLFKALSAGKASVVTDRVEAFTPKGIRLASGQELEADLVVTATGLTLLPCGGVRLAVDGRDVELPRTFTYKGAMLSGVPNMAVCVGYTNASWTLRADLTSTFVCRVLEHMAARGYSTCVPRNDDPALTPEPLLDLASGYVQRSVDAFPKQGSRAPWKMRQNYILDRLALRVAAVDDGVLRFSRAADAPAAGAPPAPAAGSAAA